MSFITRLSTMINRIVSKYKYKNTNRDWNTWVFGEWFGKKCNDSSLALANFVATNYPNIKLIWIARNNCSGIDLLDEHITILEMDSDESIELLKTAGVVFVNEGLQDLSLHGYNYSFGAIIVNLWHGIPWKKIGMDSYKKSQFFTRMYARLVYSSQTFSLFPTTSDLCSASMKTGFLIKDDSELIKTGLPRNHIFYSEETINAIREKILMELKKKSKVVNENSMIITYMPTFRDNAELGFDFSAMKGIKDLVKILEDHNAIIVQKTHIVSQNRSSDFLNSESERIITWSDCSAQELMAASYMLITDYSSCFFDFLILDRPIIHYLYDYDYYANDDRGLYYKKEDVACGDIAQNEFELLSSINNNIENSCHNSKLRQTQKERFLTFEGPDSCRIIVERVLTEINDKKG